MSAEWFLAWWNLIFIVPFGLALLYLGVYTFTGLTFGEADADVDADADLHAEADVHAEADLHGAAETDGELHGDGDVHGDAHADAHADAHTPAGTGEHTGAVQDPLLLNVLTWLGLGRVPLSLLLLVLLLIWGASGFLTNVILRPIMPASWMTVLAALPVAAWSSAVLTRWVVRAVGRWMPTTETYVRRRSELVGTAGQAVLAIDQRFGLASVRDRRGDLFQVACRVYDDRPAIAKNARVLLVDYNAEQEFFYVTEYDVDA